ncbi:MAG: adenosylcobinamide-phosphate synthase CbiB [Sulfuritalea sp.]|nr:adenosylcobinamide-phosphate synthase CbiB [Sulfuritalea sp.]MDP1982552.1 adenosylcobinamide-phosphate synthase CbiB [Sulfuritalea sp.]
MASPSLLLLALPLGLLLDRLLGEPRRWHPLVGFGRTAAALERTLRRGAPGHAIGNRLRGTLAWTLLVLPAPLACAALLVVLPWPAALAGHALLLWFALGERSLAEHVQAVAAPLAAGDLDTARQRLSWLVSRDTSALDADDIARAAVETTLENGNDAVFGALFWAALFGGPGALAFRLANTLDAMWGYRDERRIHFGWCAARADDLLGLLPARLTAVTYALLGRGAQALHCWRVQAPTWSSPNAGPVMAAGAGALGVSLGGAAIYHGRVEQRPALGCGPAPSAADIARALALVRRGSLLWAALALAAAGFGALHA